VVDWALDQSLDVVEAPVQVLSQCVDCSQFVRSLVRWHRVFDG
jgi:hypothetical protein